MIDSGDRPSLLPSADGAGGLFPATMWSAVIAAGAGDAPAALLALERLARAYWRPLYVFLRRRGTGHDEAADLVQGFFAFLLSREFLAEVRPGSGRFRNFLLVSLRRWVRDQADRAKAAKRGGDRPAVPLQELEALRLELIAAEDTPDEAFDRAWARDVFDRAMTGLAGDWSDRPELFGALRRCVDGSPEAEAHAMIGSRLGMSEGAVSKAAHDLRRRFAIRVRAEIRSTVRDDAEVDEELHHLVRLLRG